MAASINIPYAIVIVITGPLLLHIWVGDRVHPTLLLLIGLGTWTAMNTLNGPLAIILNGANIVGFQAACAISMAVVNVTCSIFLVQHIGVSGAVWGSVIAQIFCVLIPQVWYVRRFMARLVASHAQAAT